MEQANEAKMVTGNEAKIHTKGGEFPKGVTVSSASVLTQNYTFPNLIEDGVEYNKITVVAADHEQAVALWRKKRTPVIPAKVEEPNKKDNQ